MRVELYFPLDPVTVPDEKLLRLRSIITRKTKHGTGIRVFSKRLQGFAHWLQA
jgi:hypothetical protein